VVRTLPQPSHPYYGAKHARGQEEKAERKKREDAYLAEQIALGSPTAAGPPRTFTYDSDSEDEEPVEEENPFFQLFVLCLWDLLVNFLVTTIWLLVKLPAQLTVLYAADATSSVREYWVERGGIGSEVPLCLFLAGLLAWMMGTPKVDLVEVVKGTTKKGPEVLYTIYIANPNQVFR
jgi:hypothetical protein